MTTFLIIWLSLGLIAATLAYGMSLAYWWNEFRVLQEDDGRASVCIWRSFLNALTTFINPVLAIALYFLFDRARHGLLFRNPAKHL